VIKRLALLMVGIVGIAGADEPRRTDLDEIDQKALVVIKPGETKEVVLCWYDVPGGRAPDTALNEKAELSREERRQMKSVEKYESNGVAITLDWKKANEISSQLIEHDRKYWFVAAAKVEAGPQAKAGPMNVYLHYAAGTGRTVYRRGAICVLVSKDK
jgi:hypothetical protein